MVEEPFKLVIMDSITANLRVDFTGRGELAERQQRLGQIMSRLRKVSQHIPLPSCPNNAIFHQPHLSSEIIGVL